MNDIKTIKQLFILWGAIMLFTIFAMVMGIIHLSKGEYNNRCDQLWNTFNSTEVTKKEGYTAFFEFMYNHCYEIPRISGKTWSKE